MSLKDRRAHSRIVIDIPVFVSIKTDSGQELQSLLADFSNGGAQLILSPNSYEVEKILGTEVIVTKCQGDISSLLVEKKGFVCWVSPERCGIRFLSPLALSEDSITKLSEIL